MHYVVLAIFINASILFCAISAQAADKFVWLSSTYDSQGFNEIKSAFADELLSDNPEKVKPFTPHFYKYIFKIGAFRNSRLVIIGYREHENDKSEFDHFKAFYYDVVSRIKKEIEPAGVYYRWSFMIEAAFEPSSAPDIVFKFKSCLECESVELLSSFKFDEKANSWMRRIWPNNDPDLMIGSDIQYGPEDHWEYTCLYKVADFNADNFADIAIRCRETGITTHKIKDKLLLYTIQKGVAKRIKVVDKKMFNKITGILCKGQSSPLCKTNKNK